MAIGIDEIVSPNDASILSMIAARPGTAGEGAASYSHFLSQLESPLAREIASALLGEPCEVSPQARDTAEAMRRWYDVKRDRSRQARQDYQSRRRRLITRASRMSR